MIVCPIGFVADHIEVVWDLDNELREQADDAGVMLARTTTPNADRRFARLAADLIDELRDRRRSRPAVRTGSAPGCGHSLNGEVCTVRRGVWRLSSHAE